MKKKSTYLKPQITLSEEQRKQLKDAQLELVLFFDDFCKKHDLTYYLFGGTLLGAKRHAGYIPWDDDIDLCMPRKDYDKLMEIFDGEGKYFLSTPKTNGDYFYHFAKIMKEGTKYVEYPAQFMNCKNEIFIDIFPINGYPSKRLQKFHYNFWIYIYNRRSYPKSFYLDKKANKKKKSFSYKIMDIVAAVLLFWASPKKCALMRDKFMKKHQYPESPYCICGTRFRKIYERSAFEGHATLPFEGHDLAVPENFEKYLEKMYGDYMTLPPVEERVPHHYLVEFSAGKEEN